MHAFSEAHFLRAAGQARDLPPPAGPEIAFAGRSNVGKSSAINALLGRRNLARTSKTPGRTQTINFYELAKEGDEVAANVWRLVDLPGYGFARVSKALRAQWGELVGAYLRHRPTLRAVVLVMDARHPLTPLDQQLIGWLEGYPVLVLLSKSDKLGRNEQAKVLEQVGATLRQQRSAHGIEVMLYSSETKQGVEQLRGLLEDWLSGPSSEQTR